MRLADYGYEGVARTLPYAPGPTPPDPRATASELEDAQRIRERLYAMTVELEEQMRLYDETLRHIEQLRIEHAQAYATGRALAEANRRVTELAAELGERRAKEQAQLHILSQTRAELDRVRRRLEAVQLAAPPAPTESAVARHVSEHSRAMLPSGRLAGLEIATSCIPVKETSSDWVSILPDPAREEVMVLIGDATGPAASLLGVAVATTITTLHELGRAMEPSVLLDLLDVVVGNAGDHRYPMTCFAAAHHEPTHSFRYSNAGHVLPLLIGKKDLVRAQTGETRRGPPFQSGPLGYVRTGGEPPRGQRTIRLEPGDLVAFYTDGLVENLDASCHPIGVPRLIEWLRELYDHPVAEIRDGIEARIRERLEKASPIDDMTLVLARVR